MLSKIMAIASLVALPLSAALWHTSHTNPQHRRYDLTLYKSLRVILREGVCGLHVLSMPTKTASRSEFQSPLKIAATPGNTSLMVSSERNGPFRRTWVVFPFWLSTLGLLVTGVTPLAFGPIRDRRRRRNGWCVSCGYNLRGNRSGRCPECGTRFRRRASWTTNRFG